MKIRNAQVGDEKSIASVIIDTWKIAYRGIISDNFLDALTTEKHEELFRNHIVNGAETVLVLENLEKKIVGVVSGGKERTGTYDCELVAIYIIHEYQKMGYGKWLFKELLAEHRNNHFKSMIIWTLKENRDKKFYENLGGLVKEEQSYSFDGKDVTLAGYVWTNINEI